MIEYILLGLLWCAIWETIEWKHYGRAVGNLDRLVHISIWPVWVIIFIIGWIEGFLRNFDDRDKL